MGLFRDIYNVLAPRKTVISEATLPDQEMTGTDRYMFASREAPFDWRATPSHDTIVRESFDLAFKNPRAERIVRVIVDFVYGDGFQIVAENERVQEYLDKWQADSTVKLQMVSKLWATDLYTTGEYMLTPEVNEISGFVRYEPVDVTKIQNVRLRWSMPWLVLTSMSEVKEVVTVELDPSKPTYKHLQGDIIVARVNTSTMLSRGYSVLRTLGDWLKALDQFLYGELARAIAMRRFLIHVTVEDASEDDLKDYVQKYAEPPESGSVLFTNDKEDWNFKTADINSSDAGGMVDVLKTQVNVGAGMPKHWIDGLGDSANRATAARMDRPVMRNLLNYQGILHNLLNDVVLFARDQALLAGAIPGMTIDSEDIEVKIVMDQIDTEDEAAQWAFFKSMVDSISMGIPEGLITKGEGRQAAEKFLNELGIDTEVVEEMAEKELNNMVNKAQAELGDRLKIIEDGANEDGE